MASAARVRIVIADGPQHGRDPSTCCALLVLLGGLGIQTSRDDADVGHVVLVDNARRCFHPAARILVVEHVGSDVEGDLAHDERRGVDRRRHRTGGNRLQSGAGIAIIAEQQQTLVTQCFCRLRGAKIS